MEGFKIQKPANTTGQHLEKLKARGLIINEIDEINVKAQIRKIGYFRLSGYFGPLQTVKDAFKHGTSFNDIIRLYEFDKKLRVMTSYAIKAIEIELKARLTDIMSSVYESNWYMNEQLFMTEKTTKGSVQVASVENGEITYKNVSSDINLYKALVRDIEKSIRRNEDTDYIKNFRKNHGNAVVPSWMMMECISFGILSRLFSLLKNSAEKKSVAKHFGVIGPDIFTSWLHGFVVLRNACAHHARIWNKSFMDLSFPNKQSAWIVSDRDLENVRKFYGISSCLIKTLSSIDPDLYAFYKTRFNRLLRQHNIDKTAMGFPIELNQYDIWI